MATIPLTIPDDQLEMVVDALCEKFNYGQRIPGTGDTAGRGMTKAQYAKSMVAAMVKNVVLDHKRKKEAEKAMAKVTLDSINIE